MPKVILFDADGVVLKKGTEYFSERFAREYGAPNDELRAFFKNEFRLCQTSKADLKEELSKRLPGWGWQKSVEDFLDYWFVSDVVLDEAVLREVEKYRAQGVECYLTTDQEKYRAQYLLNKLEGKFDGFWFSCDLGFQKSEPEFFVEVLRKLDGRFEPSEIRYFDDDQKNVDTAKSLGIDAHFYRDTNDLL